jgi:hypothetical protein
MRQKIVLLKIVGILFGAIPLIAFGILIIIMGLAEGASLVGTLIGIPLIFFAVFLTLPNRKLLSWNVKNNIKKFCFGFPVVLIIIFLFLTLMSSDDQRVFKSWLLAFPILIGIVSAGMSYYYSINEKHE